MAIKYVCELCETDVAPVEAVGADVYEGDMRGRSFVWTDPISGSTIVIAIENPHHEDQQFCYGCLFTSVRAMMKERFPNPTVRPFAGPPTNGTGQEAIPGSSLEPMTERTAVAIPVEGNGYPDDPGESTELLELHASGELSIPSSDFRTPDPFPAVPGGGDEPRSECTCQRRKTGKDKGSIYRTNPSCPVHSPGGSSGKGGGQ